MVNTRHCGRGASAARYARPARREDGAQSNKSGHAALSAYVGDLTFSCTDAASPSTQSFDRGVLKRSEGVKSFWNSGLQRVELGDEASGLYVSKPQPEYSNCI